MSDWTISLAPLFINDIKLIANYITDTFKAPKTASKQVKRIMDTVYSLTQFPKRCDLSENEGLRTRGVRKLVVDKYVVFYLPNEESMTLEVLRVLYGARDLDTVSDI